MKELRWKPLTLIAFRFFCLYLGLFCLATQISGSLFLLPFVSFRGLGSLWPLREITEWVAAHVLGITTPMAYAAGSGETAFFWVQTLWLLTVAVIGTVIWSALDRNRSNYDTFHKWFRLFIRLALAASMFEYGMTKIIPVQFARPTLNTLVTPVGNLSLSNILWTSIGAAPAYEVFTGCAEMLGGILLLTSRTTTLGALICLADMSQVFVLNMTYDIGLKQISLHLILLALFLLGSEFHRLATFFFFPDRAAGSSTQQHLFKSAARNRIAVAVQVFLGIYLIGIQAYANWTYWHAEGDKSPRSPLYGIWKVDELSIDGEVRAPFLADYDRRWRRVIFDTPDKVAFQRIDDSFARYSASIDIYSNTIALTRPNSKWRADFTYQRPAPDHLILDGGMDGHKIHLQLELVDFDTFRLLTSGFRWIRPEEQ
ncbi:MAG TPA: hypothetical protein VGK48_26190 [Terriglobia bacterium]